jgi:glutamate-1-semialdehyde 2,1-aminomutase
MSGHSPDHTIKAIEERIEHKGGLTTMMPTTDAQEVGKEL